MYTGQMMLINTLDVSPFLFWSTLGFVFLDLSTQNGRTNEL